MPRPDYYGNPAGVTEEIEVVRAVFAAFAARDLAAALPHVSPDCEFDLRGTADRVGLLLCGDPPVALRAAADLGSGETTADLLDFCVSPEHLRARRAIGLSVDV